MVQGAHYTVPLIGLEIGDFLSVVPLQPIEWLIVFATAPVYCLSTKYVRISSGFLRLKMPRGDCLKSWTSDAQSCGVNPEWLTVLDDLLSELLRVSR